MNFINISQYFNKLQSAVLLLLIVPLLVFIALYVYGRELPSQAPQVYVLILPALVTFDWLVIMIICNKKIKSLRSVQGLGVKLEKYFRLTILRYGTISAGNLILAMGLYLTRNDLFTWFFLGGLVLSGLVWPRGPKVSNDLHLKGDEKQLVYFVKDNL
jgi:hypothetical protein